MFPSPNQISKPFDVCKLLLQTWFSIQYCSLLLIKMIKLIQYVNN